MRMNDLLRRPPVTVFEFDNEGGVATIGTVVDDRVDAPWVWRKAVEVPIAAGEVDPSIVSHQGERVVVCKDRRREQSSGGMELGG